MWEEFAAILAIAWLLAVLQYTVHPGLGGTLLSAAASQCRHVGSGVAWVDFTNDSFACTDGATYRCYRNWIGVYVACTRVVHNAG